MSASGRIEWIYLYDSRLTVAAKENKRKRVSQEKFKKTTKRHE
jgi:hypothetical protein